jgi:hypothetical protein
MIVVFVIDTSPSMRQPLVDRGETSKEMSAGSGMSRLDLAKMAVEDIARGLNKRVSQHNVHLQQQPALQKSLRNIGLGFSPNDEFLLLSTGRQHTQQPATAACGAGGRLLVGYGVDHNAHEQQAVDNPTDLPNPHQSNADSFQKALKRLQATDWKPDRVKKPGHTSPKKKPAPFPEDGGGALGLNTALSAGLQLLSRYRLSYRSTENYGMGRLPSPAVLNPSGGPAMHALQPACLILITDGVCLRATPAEGGGSLQLQYGNMPLREFYKEPFRWDQRIFCLGVGGREGISSTQYLHPHIRTLCEVTGGGHMMLRSSATLSQSTDLLLKLIAPPRPRDLPLPDPLCLQAEHAPLVGATGTFVSGGPVCTFQALEADMDSGQASPKHRATLLYVPHEQAQSPSDPASPDKQDLFQPPAWCIPESYFPSKKLDTLPPRPAQPNLLFSRYPSRLGSKSFEASSMIKALNRLDQLVLANRKMSPQTSAQPNLQVKLMNRDVYVCEWISMDGNGAKGPLSPRGMEYFPVLVVGAGRPALSEGEGNYFNIGILHVPSGTSTLASSLTSGARVSTLTILPPEAHILIPLLIRAAEAEHRALKKVAATESGKDSAGNGGGSTAGLIKKQASASRNVHLDEHWRTEFRAYLFRLPPYYQNGLKRSLRNVLPASGFSILNNDGTEGALASQCFSKTCLQKIRNAEHVANDTNERLERQEAELRRRGMQMFDTRQDLQQNQSKRWQGDHAADSSKPNFPTIGYGQYDPRSTTESFLAALRNMPAPWRAGAGTKSKDAKHDTPSQDGTSETPSLTSAPRSRNAVAVLGDLPADCLMAYYESRRRWIFGGSGLTTRGLYVEGVHNDGSNSQQCGAKRNIMNESLLSLAGVGVSQLNATTTTKMGDYRERLLWSRAPVVGCGSNDSSGVSATTSADGGPIWSVDDNAMPMTFFDPRTGEFADSVQARVRSRLMVNFGNPYKDKRADSLIPERFLSQCPSMKNGLVDDEDGVPMTPPGSPPHDSFSATEGEGEAVFAGMPISRKGSIRKSPSRSDHDDKTGPPQAKKQKMEAEANDTEAASPEKDEKAASGSPKPAPPPPPKAEKKDEKSPTDALKNPPQPRPKGAAPAAPPPPPPPKGAPKKPPTPRNPPSNRPRPPPPATNTPPQKPRPTYQPLSVTVGAKPPPPMRPKAPPKPPGTNAPPKQPGVSAPPKPPAAAKRAPPPPPQPAKQKVNPQPPPPPLDLASADKKPDVDLPPGWMCVWSKSQKRWYFFDTKSNKSVWQWPPP